MNEAERPQTSLLGLDPGFDPSRESDPSREIDPDGGLYLITESGSEPAVFMSDGKVTICCFLFRLDAEAFVLAHCERGLTMRQVLAEDGDGLLDWVDANAVSRATTVLGKPRQDATLEEITESIRSGEISSLHIGAKTLFQQLRDGLMQRVAREAGNS
jgi:hypothetical protein